MISASWWAVTMLTRPGEHETTASQLQFLTLQCLTLETFCQSAGRERKTPFPWCLIILTNTRQHVSFLYSLPSLLQVMMRVRANSNQLIFHGARVLAFVRSAPWNCKRLQLYNRGLVTLSSSSSSSSSPLFILKQLWFFCFFCKSYHYSSLQA